MTTTNVNPGFVETLSRRADAYFETQPNSRFATPFALLKGGLFVLLYGTAYAFFVFGSQHFSTLLGWASLLGVCHVLIPVNIAHDAIHDTLSSRPWVNKLGLYGMEITGANSYMYRKKHLEAHRSKELANKVNTIEAQGLLLQTEDKNKTVNLPYVFYLFYSEYMIFVRDFQLFWKETNSIRGAELQKLYATKLIYATGFLLIPFVLIKLPAWQILCALLLMYLIVTVLLVIILLMPTEKPEQMKMSDDNHFNDDWAIEVLAQNVDFSPGNRFLNNLVGGANLNVVHYLFPGTHHVHYNKLAKLVSETAYEYGLLYRTQSVKDVLGIHLSYIKNIHQQPSSLESQTLKT